MAAVTVIVLGTRNRRYAFGEAGKGVGCGGGAAGACDYGVEGFLMGKRGWNDWIGSENVGC